MSARMNKHLRNFLVIGAIALVGGGIWATRPDVAQIAIDRVMGPRPEIVPARVQTLPTIAIAEPVGWPAGTAPTPAAGLKVARFAEGLDHPRWLYVLANGDVLVAETNSPPRKGGGIEGMVMRYLLGKAGAAVPSANRITLLRDTDGDGAADQRNVLVDGLNSPLGMAVVGGWLYVANTDALVRFPFQVGQTRIDARPEKIIDLPAGENHWTRNVVANPEGDTLFVSVGSATNIAERGLELERNRAAILEVDPATKSFRPFGTGLRNPVGMAIEPVTQGLWTVVNERDMLGSDVPPDYLTKVQLGSFFGWPYSYWGGYVDRRVEPARPDLLEYTARPDYALGAHTASLGLSFANGARLGERFANGAFIGQHGSWNRKPFSGYKVLYVPFGDNGFPLKGAAPIDVLTGFLDGDKARGRPVGVTIDKAGGLLVADDVGNVIWRVSAAR